MLEDIYLDEQRTFRNGTASVAVDAALRPHVLFPAGESTGRDGFYASPDPAGDWSVEPITDPATGEPVPMFWGDIAVTPDDGRVFVLAAAGDHAELWGREGESWQRIDVLKSVRLGQRHALKVDAAGTLHAAFDLADGGNLLQAGIGSRPDGTWNFQPVGEPVYFEDMTLSLSADGKPYVAFWEPTETEGWLLRLGDTSAVETIVPLGSGGLEDININFAVAAGGPPAQAHFLVNRLDEKEDFSFEGFFFLEYIARDVKGAWKTHLVATGDPRYESPDFCFEAPPFDGAECPVDFTTYHSLGVFAGEDGEVRFLFSRLRAVGVKVAECPKKDPQSCSITRDIRYEGDLRIGWVDGNTIRQHVLLDDVVPSKATALIDTAGNLHVVCYDQRTDPTAVRYLRFGE